jgi:hypothetical protein
MIRKERCSNELLEKREICFLDDEEESSGGEEAG